MEKLYKVRLMDTIDGGHVLDVSLFETAKEARNEFLRIRKIIFNGYHYDQPDEWSWHHDSHFTNYDNSDYRLELEIVKIGKRIAYFDIPELNDTDSEIRLFDDPDDPFSFSVSWLFDSATKDASIWCTLPDYRRGFKKIYNDVKRRLGDSLIRCEYSSEEEGYSPAQMDYFIRLNGSKTAVVTVSRSDFLKGSYSYHITV